MMDSCVSLEKRTVEVFPDVRPFAHADQIALIQKAFPKDYKREVHILNAGWFVDGKRIRLPSETEQIHPPQDALLCPRSAPSPSSTLGMTTRPRRVILWTHEPEMSNLTRRDLFKSSIAASAIAVGQSNAAEQSNAAAQSQQGSAAPSASSPSVARERLLLDFGWRFHLGHADD